MIRIKYDFHGYFEIIPIALDNAIVLRENDQA